MHTVDSVEVVPVDYFPLVSQTSVLVDKRVPSAGAEAVLRLLPSVDVRERGGRSTQADIAIRGGSFDQTMVMLNGVDFSDARTGHQSHSLPVDIDILDDLVVLDGTVRAGALAGALDFRTVRKPHLLRAKLEGGAWGYGYGNLSGGWSNDRWNTLGAVSYKRSDGYRPNTDFWNLNTYARAGYESRRVGNFDFQAGFQRREWGSNGFYSLAYPDQFESTRTALGSLRWKRVFGRVTLSATGSYRRNDDLFEMVRGAGGNEHTTHTTAAELGASYEWRRLGITSVSGGYTHNRMLSTALGDRTRRMANATIGHVKSWQSGSSIAGKASVVRSSYGTTAIFAASGSQRLGLGWFVVGGGERSTRLPTFTELFYNVKIYRPNPNLRPETAVTYRLGIEKRSTYGFSGDAMTWYRRTRNVIDWEQRPDADNPGRSLWWATQSNRLSTFGAEISARYTNSRFRAALNYGWIHNDMTVSSDYISKYALDYMRHKISGIVGVDLGWDISASLIGSYYDRAGSWIGTDGKIEGYKPYFLLDGRVSWSKRALQVYVDGTNLLGTNYFDFGGLTMPGTWLSAGVVITLK